MGILQCRNFMLLVHTGKDMCTAKWIKFIPEDYEKKEYDILLFSGEQRNCCWPNAGKFMSLKNQKSVAYEDVEFVRDSLYGYNS